MQLLKVLIPIDNISRFTSLHFVDAISMIVVHRQVLLHLPCSFIWSTWSSAVCGLRDVAGRTLVCVFGRRVCGVRAREVLLAFALGRLNCGIEQGASKVPASHSRSTFGRPHRCCVGVHAGFASLALHWATQSAWLPSCRRRLSPTVPSSSGSLP